MDYIINLWRSWHFRKVCIVFSMAVLVNQPLWAAIQAKNVSIYTDKKTGITLVFAEVTLTGYHQVEQPESGAALTELVTVSVKNADADNADDINNDEFESYLTSSKTKLNFTVAGILRDIHAKDVVINFSSYENGLKETVNINLTEAKNNTASRDSFNAWIQNRFLKFDSLAEQNTPNLIVDIWKERSRIVYGQEPYNLYSWKNQRSAEDAIDSLAIFGGQTAIRETLQKQLLENTGKKDLSQQQPIIEVATIKGVEVKAHPYDAMLKTLQATQVAPSINSLANYVPVDRFMVLIRDPKDIANLLSTEDDTFNQLSPLLGDGFVDNALLERYTARFGLTPEQLKQWFSGNNVEEIAVFAPDVFFLDSTDLTAIIRLKPDATTPFKVAQNIPKIVLPLKLPGGETFYLTSRDNLLFLSTEKSELAKSLKLADEKGKGSLAQSSEFQVMSYKLPLEATSKVYVYFSDPFIRRLTSPEIKIGQLRRAIAVSNMQTITAMSLLYQLDQGVEAKSIAELKAKGYLTADEISEDEFTLEQGNRVISKTWGTLDRLKTLLANPVVMVSQDEQQNYIAYRERYTSFWREYFDPIAVKVDMTASGKIIVETFILPLIDNSIYTDLKEMVGTAIPKKTELPIYSQAPIATLAFDIPKKEAISLLDNFYYVKYSLSPLISITGNTFVLSIQDAEPVVQTYFPGLASIDNEDLGFLGGNGKELILVPIIGSFFTRPIDIAVQVTDEEKANKVLKNMFIPFENDRYYSLSSVYDKKNNRLLLDWTLFNVIRMEFSITVEKGWLHISNHPWTAVAITGTEIVEPNHASIMFNPMSLKKGLPQVISLAQAAYRQSVYVSAAELLPWMMAYNVSAETALIMQKHALGRGTPLPSEASIDYKLMPVVNPYGQWRTQEISKDIESDVRFMQLLQAFNIWLRFEEEGLRSRAEFILN